jgi:branched-chain amino acid transport system ATP-binding protein
MTEAVADRPVSTGRDGEVVLETANLTKQFGSLTAVDGVDLTIEDGEFRSVIGPNGAGKTTLFNLVSGAMQPTTGSITFLGADVTALSPAERVSRGLARSFQLTTLFNGLTVRENVRLAAQAAAYDDLSRVRRFFADTGDLARVDADTDRVVDSIGLSGQGGTQASKLAYGDRRRLEIGLVLATDPEVVLLDEPTAGMSGDETEATIDLVEEVLADETIVLVEHDVELVMRVSDRITVLNGGRVLATGPPEEIAGDDDVQEAYLGGYEA